MPGGARTGPVRSGFTHEGRLQTVEANPLFVRARVAVSGCAHDRLIPVLLPFSGGI
jgi:hypothetical protein